MSSIIALAIGFASRLGLASTGAVTPPAFAGLAITANWLLFILGSSARTYRWWLRYVFAIFDVFLLSSVVFLFGAPVLALTYVLIIVPYSFDRGPTLGYVTALASTGGFMLASWGFALTKPYDAVQWQQVLIAAVLLLAVSQEIIRMPARLVTRIRQTRQRMVQVELGDMNARAEARAADELGFLERSFNRMLDELSLLIEAVQGEADEVAAVAMQVHGSASVLLQEAGELSKGASTLSQQLAVQRSRAEEGARASHRARDMAGESLVRADATAQEAGSVDDAAKAGRLAIERAAQQLVAIGEDVGAAANTVRLLEPASERVGEFVATVSRIAKQTNLLALNASIEASRAGEEGVGFAVVAEEIRKLALECSTASKVIAKTVQRVREDISSAVDAISRTAGEVSGAGTVAREATLALENLVDGIARMAAESEDAATLAETQASLSTDVAQAFDAVEKSADRASEGAHVAAQAVAAQRTSIDELRSSAAQLSNAAARLRGLAIRHRSPVPITSPNADNASDNVLGTTACDALFGSFEPLSHGFGVPSHGATEEIADSLTNRTARSPHAA